MPRYIYKAQDGGGERRRGLMYADSEGELHMRLRESGLFLISYAVKAEGRHIIAFRSALKAAALSDFNRQLGQLIGSGISLVRALGVMTREESVKPRRRAVYEDMLRLIRQGSSLSDALEAQGVFPPLMVGMYRAAEASGGLETTARRLAANYDREHRLNMKIKNATSYTKVLCVLTLLVLIAMFAYILPRFEAIFAGIRLPAGTRLLYAVRDLFKYRWPALCMAASLAAIVFHFLFKMPAVRCFRDRLKLRLPVIGKLMKTIYTARFARTLSSLYSSGLPIVSALQAAKNTVGNAYICRQFDGVVAEVRAGGGLSSALEKVDGFSQKLSASAGIGEEAGALDSMLASIADVLEYEAEASLIKLVGLLEPTLLVAMAAIVGFIALSMIAPVFNSYSDYSVLAAG